MNIQAIADQIIQVIEYISQKMGIAINWTADNVIPMIEMICQKYITWEIVTSITWSVLNLIVIFITIFWHKNYRKRLKNDSNYWDFLNCAEPWFLIIITIISIFLLVDFILQIFDIIRCICFPELQIFKYVKEFIQINAN